MKNIKSFGNYNSINESAQTYHCITVTFNPKGETTTALYINGKLYKYGDYYHDKIEIYAEAFIEGLKYAGCDVKDEDVNCNNDEVNYRMVDLADYPPENFSDLRLENE